MNIACYSHYFTPEIGAPSARINDMARQWLAMGHGVQVVTCYPNHPTGLIYPGYSHGRYMHEKMEGLDVHRNWSYVTPNRGFIKKSLGHLSFLAGAMMFSNRHVSSPDVAMGTSPTFFAAMAAARLAASRRIPFVMEVRDLWPAIFVDLGVLKNPFLIGLLEKWEMALYRRAVKVVTVTDAFRRNIIERGIEPEKVITITNGADVDFWTPRSRPVELAQRLGLENKFIILYIGAHGISHALGRILDSAIKLRDNSDIHFLFVGEGAEKDELVNRARSEKIDNVTFLDPVGKDEVPDYYALADVCLAPLRDIPLFDTFIPSKIFEIMAMARPMIGSVRGETADILKRSEGALVVEPEDSDSIAEAILKCKSNPETSKAMGERGRVFVCDFYSRKALAERYAGVFDDAMEEYRSRR